MRTNNTRTTRIITGFIGLSLMYTFIIGLAKSIAEGFAGFKGALPFMIIVAFVLSLALYNFYEDCIRANRNNHSQK